MPTKPASGALLDGTNPLVDSTLKAFWAFLEGTGSSTSADSQGNHPLTINAGGWSTDAAGPVFRISAANAGPLSIGTPFNIGNDVDFSIVFGAKQANNDTQGMLIGDNSTTTGFFWLAGGSYFGMRDNANNDFNFSSQNNFTTLHNYAITYNKAANGGAGYFRVYKDGVEIADSPISAGNLHATWTLNTIGNAYSGTTALAFIGDISYIGVYVGRTLSDTEVATYNTNPYGIFVAGTAYNINAAAGSYSTTGADITVRRTSNLNAAGGTYSVTGSDAQSSSAAVFTLSLDAGSYTTTGSLINNPSAISITNPTAKAGFQRDVSNQASIPIVVSVSKYSANSGGIEAWFDQGGSANYSTIIASPVNGSNSGTLANQPTGIGVVRVRYISDTGINASKADVAIGDVAVAIGDSRMNGRGDNAQSYSHATLKSNRFDADNGSTWSDNVDSGATHGTILPLIATQHMAEQGVPFIVVKHGQGSTDLVNGFTSWAKDGTHTDYDAMIAAVTASKVNAVKYVIALFGPNGSVNAGLTRAQARTALTNLATNVAADLPGAPVLYVDIFGESGASDVDSEDSYRNAVVDLANSGILFVGANQVNDNYADDVHPTTDAQLLLQAKRYWLAIKRASYAGGNVRGPHTSSIILSDPTHILLTYDQPLSNADTTSISGYRIKDNGSIVSGGTNGVTSATVIAPNQVAIVVASSIVGTPTIDWEHGNALAGVSTIPFSVDQTMAVGTAVQLPAEPMLDHPMTQTLSVNLAAGSYSITGSLTQANFGLTALPGSYPIIGKTAYLRGPHDPANPTSINNALTGQTGKSGGGDILEM